ncbi:MAG: transglutaminase domain-containing protein [Oscillospiraceae bacterium]
MKLFKKSLLIFNAVLILPVMSACSLKGTPIGDNPDLSERTSYYYISNIYENNPGQAEKIAVINEKTYNDTIKRKTDVTKYIPKATEYYSKKLSDDEKRVYSQIYKGLINYESDITVASKTVSKDDINDFITYITCTSPQIHQLAASYGIYTDRAGYVTGLKMNYSRSEEQGVKELEALQNEVKRIAEKADKLSDFEKLKYFHDQIILKCDYDDSGENPYSAYGCLIDGKAVCEGYSKAMALLCEQSGIPCINVVGTVTEENGETQSHMWNMVELSGKWYHIDVTWDDPKDVFSSDYIRYDYFNLDDESISSDHELKTTAYMKYPVADSREYNYFIKNGLYIKESDDVSESVLFAVEQSLKNSDKYVRIKCQSEEKFKEVKQEIFNKENHNFFNILRTAAKKYDSNIKCNQYAIAENENTLVFTIQLKE